MGSTTFNAAVYQNYSRSVSAKPQAAIFTNRGLHAGLDPSKITMRESRDSIANPTSTPIAIFCDVTGSMGSIATQIVKTDLGKVAIELMERQKDLCAHILLGAIGDAKCDNAPLQATQFEADSEPLVPQIEQVYMEGGGGGNGGESYSLAHLFAAQKTVSDSFSKRGKKGFLFTIGDESCHEVMTKDELTKLGFATETDITAKQAIAMARTSYEVFHIVVETESTHHQGAIDKWKELLPERVIVMKNLENLAEIIVSAIQVVLGHDKAAVISSWDGSTALTVKTALKDITSTNSAIGGPVSV